MWVTAVKNPRGGEYGHHQAVWDLFPEVRNSPDPIRPFVFRDIGRLLLVLSSVRPDSKACFDIKDRIHAGKVYAFNVLCKAYRDGRSRNNPKGYRPRRPYLTDEERTAWFERRLDGAAEAESLKVTPRPKRRLKKPDGRTVKFVEFELSGDIYIKHRYRFLEILANGIGQGKAWGCGMLILPEVMQNG